MELGAAVALRFDVIRSRRSADKRGSDRARTLYPLGEGWASMIDGAADGGDPAAWLTVIMPVYRGERWIEAALKSVAEEGDRGIEVIAIDSSPDDASAAILRSFGDRLRLRIEERSPFQSWQSKTNRAAAMATAPHLCWLHQDDLWYRGRAAAVRRWIADAPDAALHLAPSAIVDSSGRKLGTWHCPFRRDGAIDRKTLLERLLVQNFVSAPAPVFRKEAWQAAGGMDEELWYTGDWDVWLKLAMQGPVHYHRQVTTAFRIHGTSQTVTGSRNSEDFERQMRIVLDRHLPQLASGAARVRRASLASIKLNGALAAAAGGRWHGLVPALGSLLALGPLGIRRFLRDTRIVDRLMPRVRARLSGGF